MIFMMKKISLFLLVVFFYSCKEGNDNDRVELEIINKEFICYSGDDYYFFSEQYQKKYLTKYKYKVTNNSDHKYVFNLSYTSSFLFKRKEYFNTKDVLVFSSKNDSLEVFGRLPQIIENNCWKNYYDFIERNLGERSLSIEQNEPFKRNCFILSPGETRYIENYVILPYGDDYNSSSIRLKSKNDYNVNVKIWSDSTSIKETFDDSELRTFKENGYEFYHGVINSKNKVPLKMME